MFIELHILQNFVPSNLNRSDTGAPKSCEFGGYRRARISSQCLKRAMRQEFKKDQLLPPTVLGVRTKRLIQTLAGQMIEEGKPEDQARLVAITALTGLEIGQDGKNPEKTQYLLFLGNAEIRGLVSACLAHWDALLEAAPRVEGAKDKKKKKAELPDAVAKAMETILDGGKAADVALFGRMLADLPEKNVDAASQIAHAISSNRVETEFDFYTAVDDLKPEDTAGADMLGTIEFNSACFYRYANLDVDQLRKNLQGDDELTTATIRAWLMASVEAVPTGKQNSMAAHNPPSLVFAAVRERGLRNLANAFVQPVRPDREGDLVSNSARQLDNQWVQLGAMYGDGGLLGTALSSTEPKATPNLGEAVPLTELVDRVVSTVRGAGVV